MRIIDKRGPLNNPAHRDHCLQYMVAVGLIKGSLCAADYEDDVAADPRIDALREKMEVSEEERFSKEYLDPEKRCIANALQVYFADGTRTAEVTIDYPIGHRRRRAEGLPMLMRKFEWHLARCFPPKQAQEILEAYRSMRRASMPWR